jgi:outer membrane receptor protein involved in Fe transport
MSRETAFPSTLRTIPKLVVLAAGLAMADAAPTFDAGPSSISGEELSLSDLMDIKLQTGSFLELDMAKSPVSMTIIDREKIELAGANTLSELLEIYVPGFQYTINKWNGVMWGMRGVANDRNTKFIVLVNGHKMNTEARDGFFSETSMGLFGEIERIEVLRGPAGLVYGSGAIAGVVNIVTRDASRNGAEVETKGRTWSTGFGNTQKSIQGTVFGRIDGNQSFTGTMGWEQSDGVGMHVGQIYGHPTWPSDTFPQPGGSPTNGSALSTPGNWKADADWRYKGLRISGRFTHSVQEASGWFAEQPWPSYVGNPSEGYSRLTAQQTALKTKIDAGMGTSTDSAALSLVQYQLGLLAPVVIDGKSVSPTDPYWSGTASGGVNNRREYIADNIALDATYDWRFGEDVLKLHAAFDGNTDKMGVQSLPGYDAKAATDEVIEDFGERRYTLGAMVLVKSVPRLQLAVGAEQRFDDLGEGLDGKDEEDGNPLHVAVAKVWYTNTAVFTEGFYDISGNLGLNAGARWDGHTRTIDDGGTFDAKVAAVYTPARGHSVKLVFQSSSNNGTDDDYENGRYQVDDRGVAYSAPHFLDATRPGGKSNMIIAGVSAAELHALKPEKAYSFELTSNHELGRGFSVSPSVSYNMVRNLFLWYQPLARVVNAGGYDFMNFDLVAEYKTGWLEVGANHTSQYVVNTDVNSQAKTLVMNYMPGDTGVRQADGTYIPTPGLTSTVVVNPVHDNITRDGTHFTNLCSNVSKLFVNVKPVANLTFHSDVRVFWGLVDGRDSGIALQESKGYHILDAGTDPSIKWNASVHIELPDNWNVGLYAYDILGIDDSRSSGKFATNTLRSSVVFSANDVGDLYAQDLQSFAMELRKSF